MDTEVKGRPRCVTCVDEFLSRSILGVPVEKQKRRLCSEFAALLQLCKACPVCKSISRRFSHHDRRRVEQLCVERSRQESAAGAGRGEASDLQPAVSVPCAQGGLRVHHQEKDAEHGPAVCPTRKGCPSELTARTP